MARKLETLFGPIHVAMTDSGAGGLRAQGTCASVPGDEFEADHRCNNMRVAATETETSQASEAQSVAFAGKKHMLNDE